MVPTARFLPLPRHSISHYKLQLLSSLSTLPTSIDSCKILHTMAFTTGDNASKEKDPQSLDYCRQDAPLSGRYMTQTNFGPRPSLEKFGTAKQARTPDDSERDIGYKKRLAILAESHTPSDEVSAGQRPIVKHSMKELELVKAAKEGRSITSRPIRSGSL